VQLCITPKVNPPPADYSFTISKLYKTRFDALSVAGPVDITKNMFYIARADDETELAAARWKIATT